MFSVLKYILLCAIRDRLYIGLFVVLATSFSFSIFLGSTSLIEQQQATAAYIAGSSRAILAIGSILFICLNVGRAFDNKEIEFMISKSISRQKFIIASLLGFFSSIFLILIPLVLAIFFVVKPNPLGLAIWAFSLVFELMILSSFSFLSSLILRNSFLGIMSSFAFYAISRLMGVFVLAINLPQNIAEAKSNIFASLLKIISAALPRLDLFGQSSWLSYGVENFEIIKLIALQSLIYLPLLIFMAFHDFRKKQF